MEIPKHRHCLNCGVSIPPDQVFCSEKCKIEYIQRRKRMLRTQYMFLATTGYQLNKKKQMLFLVKDEPQKTFEARPPHTLITG